MEPYGVVDSLIPLLLHPVRGHPRYGSWGTPSRGSSMRPHGEWEGAVLLLCRLSEHLPEVFASDMVRRTARCLTVSEYRTCYSISA